MKIKWRLPNQEELNSLYERLHVTLKVGGFKPESYWCTDHKDQYAWFQNFYCGTQNYGGNFTPIRVRGVRTFESRTEYNIGDMTETGIIFWSKPHEYEYKECKHEDEIGSYNWNEALNLFKERRG